ncbi:hypothetical protein RGQ29_018068 [Quercus rubra]|uniref:Uncharacterized protein n=1 Tax=Quercus rubra TaxID=3512 RepID=A0AAN7J1G7_QUERU|nr:hypothetical protein RGQ29_018068 [Quercus rubra]
MDLLHNLLNTVLLPLTLTVLFLFTPPFLFLKFLWSLKRSIYFENAADKVILITGASSGFGKHVAYGYAKRGVRLALVARREDCLQVVANKARKLGSPEVIVLCADVSKVEECKRFVDEADINFWGSVYSTHYAVPYLRKSKGEIVVIASTGAWLSTPKFSFYNASKAALISFFETLRTEFGLDIGITIVNPGVIESEMTQSDYLLEIQADWFPTETTDGSAKAILDSACNGDMYLTEPSWMKAGFWVKILCPEKNNKLIMLLVNKFELALQEN